MSGVVVSGPASLRSLGQKQQLQWPRTQHEIEAIRALVRLSVGRGAQASTGPTRVGLSPFLSVCPSGPNGKNNPGRDWLFGTPPRLSPAPDKFLHREIRSHDPVQQIRVSKTTLLLPQLVSNLQCDVCGKTLSHSGNLKRHMASHTQARRFACPHPSCGKRFLQRSHLKTHSRVHTGERPFECSQLGCGRRFTQKGHLKSHMKLHGRSAQVITHTQKALIMSQLVPGAALPH